MSEQEMDDVIARSTHRDSVSKDAQASHTLGKDAHASHTLGTLCR